VTEEKDESLTREIIELMGKLNVERDRLYARRDSLVRDLDDLDTTILVLTRLDEQTDRGDSELAFVPAVW